MRGATAAILAVLAIGLSFSAAQEATISKLIGAWARVKGGSEIQGTELNIQFANDGKVAVEFTLGGRVILNVDGTYTVKDEAIALRFKVRGKEQTATAKIKKLTATELHIEYEKGKLEEYRKQ